MFAKDGKWTGPQTRWLEELLQNVEITLLGSDGFLELADRQKLMSFRERERMCLSPDHTSSQTVS